MVQRNTATLKHPTWRVVPPLRSMSLDMIMPTFEFRPPLLRLAMDGKMIFLQATLLYM